MNRQGSPLVQEELEPEFRILPNRMPSDAELHFRDMLSVGMFADSSRRGLDQLEKMPLCILCVLSCFSHVQLFGTLWAVAHLCSWDSPGKNTRVVCHGLLQRIFPTRGSNLHLPAFSCIASRFFTH